VAYFDIMCVWQVLRSNNDEKHSGEWEKKLRYKQQHVRKEDLNYYAINKLIKYKFKRLYFLSDLSMPKTGCT